MCLFDKPDIPEMSAAPAPQAPVASPFIRKSTEAKSSALVGTDGAVQLKKGLSALRVDKVGNGLNIPTTGG